MKPFNRVILTTGILLLASLLSPVSLAGLPGTLSYQGYLIRNSGVPVQGLLPMRFALYDVESGGTAIWWSDTRDVLLENGLFSVQLGSTNPFPDDLFEQSLWLGVAVGSEPEMTPRRPISAAAFAFRAPVCVAGDFIHCYTGPPATKGVGVCASGTRSCNAQAGFGACEGEATPTLEVCDGLDNDCNGQVDDGAPGGTAWYPDLDADGYGDGGSPVLACSAPPGHVADGSDCDDSDSTINPGADEVCDGQDNDCDGLHDEQAVDAPTWYQDADSDSYGDSGSQVTACSPPFGYVAAGGDCNDGDASTYPGAAEFCDGQDNDCDGQYDEQAVDAATWFRDLDSDGYGDSSSQVTACDRPAGYAAAGGDCDDGDASTHPGADEFCDDRDNDCDGQYDEQAVDAATWYRDADGDGYGDPGSSTGSCNLPLGYVADSSDCDDSNADIYPGASEACDGQDNDCDTLIDETCLSLGQSCVAGSQCSSGSCVDGVCCDSACTSSCESCLATIPGSCSFVPAGTDPDNECPTSSCDGLGACQ